MTKTKTDLLDVPVDQPLDPEVISFRSKFGPRSPLDEIVKEGARRMLQTAIDAEVDGSSSRMPIALPSTAGGWSSES